ncbi:MAG: Lrp/AsnC family transcriptional regulator [Caulobacter sp.]
MQLDSFDLKILDILQRDGRITNARLALDVGLSESACFNRVRRLEQQKILQRYGAQIDRRALGSFVTVLVSVILESHKQHELTRFEQVVSGLPEVVECNYVAGQFDYLLKVIARDMTDYMRVMDELMEAFGKVNQYSSYIVMRKTKEQEMTASYLVDKTRRSAA